MARERWAYLAREAALILLWAYVLLVAGSVNGFVRFWPQAISFGLMLGVVGGWLIWCAVRGRPLTFTGLEPAMLAFLLTLGLSVAFSQDVRRSLPLLAQAVVYILIFYAAFDFTRSSWPSELTEKTLLIAGGIIIGLALVDVLTTWLNWLSAVIGLPYAPSFRYRTYAVMGDPNLLAATLNLMMPLAIARALASPSHLPRVWLSLWMLGALAVLYFTSSRGGMFGLSVALVTLVGLWVLVVSPPAYERLRGYWRGARARWWLWLPALMLLLIALAALVWRGLNLQGSAMQPAVLESRSGLWQVAWAAFQRSPWVGVGPGTYPSEYMQVASLPPNWPFLHAHSVVINTLAEAGLIGLAGVIVNVIFIGRALWQARHQSAYAARARWAAITAAWAGFATHSQVDDHTRALAVAVPLAILLGVVLAESNQPVRRYSVKWVFIPGVFVAAFSAYSLYAYALAHQATEASRMEAWPRAAQLLEQAQAADPTLNFYHQQAGLAHSQLAAQGDEAALTSAITDFETALAREPNYAVTYANLAALYWQAGRTTEAVQTLRMATQLAPQAADFWVNLGLYEEALNAPSAASAAYTTALQLRPTLTETAFWSHSALRSGLVVPPAAPTLQTTVRQHIAASQLADAEQVLVQAWQLNHENPAVYAGLAEVAYARGDLKLAQRYLFASLAIQSLANRTEAALLLAEISAQLGEQDRAQTIYASVFEQYVSLNSLGLGGGWQNLYAFFTYQRYALQQDLAPQVQQFYLTQTVARRLWPLVKLYEQAGEIEEAVIVRETLLLANPTLAAEP